MRIARSVVQIAAEHQAAATHLGHVRQLGELCLHIGTHLGSTLGIIAAHECRERRGACRDGQAATAKSRAVVAGLKHVGDFLLCHHGAHRHAIGNALGKAHNVGLHAIGLECKRLAGAEDAALDLVGDQHGAHLVCQVARRRHKLLGHGVHTALALNRLEHDGADLASQLLKDRTQLVDIVGRTGHKTARQRTETILQPILHGGGNGLERTAVEAAAHAHDGVATVTGTLGIQARELHRALVGFGAGVGKERLPHLLVRSRGTERGGRGLIASGDGIGKHARTIHVIVSELGQQRRDLTALLNVEVIGNMHELFGLCLERREHSRVAVTKAAYTNTGKKVEILATIVAGELHAITFDKLYRGATKSMHNVMGFERLLGCK